MPACHPATIFICCLAVLLNEPTFGQRRGFENPGTIRARFDHQVKKRLDQDGNFSTEAILQVKAQLDARRQAGPRKANDATAWNWEWLGPGNVGGRIKDILINPYDRNIFWIASPGGGIWKTTNRGLSWSPINDFLPVLNVVSLAMDELNTQNMYAGTGEYEYLGGYGQPTMAGRRITGVGIYKSTDGGASWLLLASTQNPDFYYVSCLVQYPASVNRVLAGTASGLLRTTDGGTSWIKLLSPSFGEAVRDVEIDPANPLRIVAGTTTDAYLSADGGATWSRKTNGLVRGGLPSSPGRCELAIARTNTNIFYLSIALSGGGDQLWVTRDGGATWSLRKSNSTRVNSYTSALWVSPTDPNFLAVGGTDWLCRSADGGATFTIVSDWTGYHSGRTTPGFSAHGDFHVIVHDPAYDGSTNKIVFVGNDGGIQRASDITSVSMYNGWTNLANNLGITQFYGGAASPDGKFLVGGTQDLYNVNYYADKPSWGSYSGVGGWWNFIYGDGGFAAIDYLNPAYVYTEAQWLGMDRSTDGGKTYSTARNGLLDAASSSKALFVAPFVMDPNDPQVLVAGGTSIWRTTNRAAQWNSIRSPLGNNAKCSAIDIYKSNSSVIWVGYENGLISYTTDGGSSWTNAGAPAGTRFVTDIAINPTPTAYAEVIVTVGGYSSGNVWLSSDNGSTWINRTGQAPDNLPAVQVNSVRYHPLHPNWVYVGTDLGVFASADKGMHWEVMPFSLENAGPANTVVEELFWQGTSHLVAATHGRGMFRCSPPLATDVQPQSAATAFALDQNFPNPFNPSTTIRYALPRRSYVMLTIFDVVGRQVAALIDGDIEAGHHEVQFSAPQLSSGVYFYRLQADGFTQTKTLCVVK
jgi:photosystem II stability/assembly factor-like uncharacterized protein